MVHVAVLRPPAPKFAPLGMQELGCRTRHVPSVQAVPASCALTYAATPICTNMLLLPSAHTCHCSAHRRPPRSGRGGAVAARRAVRAEPDRARLPRPLWRRLGGDAGACLHILCLVAVQVAA